MNKKIQPLLLISIMLIFFSGCASVPIVEKKQILFIQQEKPGHLITTSIIDREKDGYLSITGMGAINFNKNILISKKEFIRIWELINIEDMEVYRYQFGEHESTTGLNFYTIVIIQDRTEKYMKIPFDDINDYAHEVVNFMKNHEN